MCSCALEPLRSEQQSAVVQLIISMSAKLFFFPENLCSGYKTVVVHLQGPAEYFQNKSKKLCLGRLSEYAVCPYGSMGIDPSLPEYKCQTLVTRLFHCGS